jgi:hypothetical protein
MEDDRLGQGSVACPSRLKATMPEQEWVASGIGGKGYPLGATVIISSRPR